MSKLSEFLLATTADSEDSIDDLLMIMSPKDADASELGLAFTNELGYNPITYFDEKSINDSLDMLIEGMKASPTAINTLLSSRQDIVKDVLDYMNDSKTFTIVEGISAVIPPLLTDADANMFKRSIGEIFDVELSDDEESGIPIDDEEISDEYTEDDLDEDGGVDIDDYSDDNDDM